jgi:hypothetical protein
MDPPASLPREGGARAAPLGVGRPPGSAEPGRDPDTPSFGGNISTTLPTSVTNVSMYNSPWNHPWKSIKGGEPLSIYNTSEGE